MSSMPVASSSNLKTVSQIEANFLTCGLSKDVLASSFDGFECALQDVVCDGRSLGNDVVNVCLGRALEDYGRLSRNSSIKLVQYQPLVAAVELSSVGDCVFGFAFVDSCADGSELCYLCQKRASAS